MPQPLRVTVWHEYRHDNPHAQNPNQTAMDLYPDGMHAVMKSALLEHLAPGNPGNPETPGSPASPASPGVTVTTATLDQDENHGLSDELLQNTDVLTWWGHCAHADVQDTWAEKIAQRVRQGMGLIVLHSGHYSKPFKRLMGTHCHLKWREAAEKERLWNVSPGHPITAGLSKDYIELEHTEMYGEHFDIPTPDELVFVSWFEGGEVFRSGCVWKRGAGKIFYFRPGHETFPIYHHPDVRRVLANAAQYVAPTPGTTPYRDASPNITDPLEKIKTDHQADASLHQHNQN